jgi:hypothetical protein
MPVRRSKRNTRSLKHSHHSLAVAQALGWTDEQLDALFIEASGVEY